MENEWWWQGLAAGEGAVGEGRAGQLFEEEVKFPLSPLHIHVVDLAVKSQFCFAFLTDFPGLIMWKNL